MISPVLETMPEPLTPSDREHLDRTRAVVRIVRGELGMRV